MNPKVKALLWERWKRTYWGLIAACLLPFSERLLHFAGLNALENPDTAIKTYWFFGILGFVMLTFMLLVGQSDSQNLELSFQKRLFRLPVRTTTLIAVYTVYGIAAIAFQSIVLLVFEDLFFESIKNGWAFLLIFETVYIVLQTFSWLGATAFYSCIILSVTGVIILPFFTDRYYLHIFIPTIILISTAISFFNVSANRHGFYIKDWKVWEWTDSFLGMFRKKPEKHFISPLQAQIWFESRKSGYVFPFVTLCIVGPLFVWVIVRLAMGKSPSESVSYLIPLSLGLTIIAAFIAGMIGFIVYYRDNTPGVSGFWLRRPIATQKLAVARLHAMIRSVLCVIAIMMITALIVTTLDWATGASNGMEISPVKWALKYSSPLETVTMTMLGLYGFIIFYWVLLQLSPLLMRFLAAVIIIVSLMKTFFGEIVESWMWIAIIISVPAIVVISFYVARRRNLVSTISMLYSLFLFPVAVISLWAFPWWLTTAETLKKGLPSLNTGQILIVIGTATLPFLPVALTPLIMDKLRHR